MSLRPERVYAVNPVRLARRLYSPAGSPAMTKRPAASVCVVRTTLVAAEGQRDRDPGQPAARAVLDGSGERGGGLRLGREGTAAMTIRRPTSRMRESEARQTVLKCRCFL